MRAGASPRHRAQAHRAQAELAHGVQKVGRDQPERAHLDSLAPPPEPGITRIAKLSDTHTSPMVNLVGLEGSRSRRRAPDPGEHRGEQPPGGRGATDWQPARREGEPEHPRSLVARWAKRLRVEPACSNTDQKIIAATNSTSTTTSRLRSSVVHFAARNMPGEERDRRDQENETEGIAHALGGDSHDARGGEQPEEHGAAQNRGESQSQQAPLRRLLLRRLPPARDTCRRCPGASSRPGTAAGRRTSRWPPREPPVPRALGRDPGRGEDPAELLALREPAADQGRDEGARVDPHVVEREPRVASLVLRRIQLAHQRADVGLEQAGPERDQAQPGVEGRDRRDREADVPQHDEDAAVERRPPLAEKAVGEPARPAAR